MEYNELYHHGVQGMKWGVRRFQNKDGSLTAAGKKRVAEREKMSPEKKKEIAKKVATAAVALGTVAAATAYAKKHPEKIASVINKVKDVNVKELSKSSIEKGKAFVKESAKNAVQGTKEGIKEGMREAPKKAAKVVVTGVVLNQVKKSLDNSVGKQESAKIFRANDPKMIGKFWNVRQEEDKND